MNCNRRLEEIITHAFGNYIEVAKKYSPILETQESIVRALFIFQASFDLYDKRNKLDLALGYIAESVLMGDPINLYLPSCLRFYYDEQGEQQFFTDLEDHEVITKKGESLIKDGSETRSKILADLEPVIRLQSLGVPINIIIPLMDHETLRPERMHTPENLMKARMYLEALRGFIAVENLPVQVISSIDTFGIPSQNHAFKEILLDINQSAKRIYFGESLFRISDKTFEHSVDEEHRRNKVDEERSQYYRSREFARLCREHDFGEARVHAIQMGRAIVKLPKGAEIDKLVFNTEDAIVVIS
jgi:hypothetical protein